jgi:hypothetical protein
MGGMIRIAIPETLPTPNVLLRLHWSKRGRIQRRVATMIGGALLQAGWRPGAPLAAVEVRIRRYSAKQPDPDALPGTAKLILDALQPASKRHPYGLGVIADDSAKCVKALHVEHVGKRQARTEIEIEAAE